jgi:hypothetical protein
MKKIEVIMIGLFLIMATAFTIGSAQTETTYYCYNNGEWSVCTPSEAIIAEEAMTKETPMDVTQEEFDAIINSNEPFLDYTSPTLASTPVVAATPEPTEKPSQAPSIGSSGAGSVPALTSCSGDCTCLDPATASQVGLPLCGGSPLLCNYDTNHNPLYCYSRAAVASAVETGEKTSAAGIPLGVFTILGAVGTVILLFGLCSIKKN